jgi:hypothetical protein
LQTDDDVWRMSQSQSLSDKRKKGAAAKFLAGWLTEYTWIAKVNDETARCKLCNTSFRVTAGGQHDVVRHSNGPVHKRQLLAKAATPSVNDLFRRVDPFEQKVTTAEVMFSYFVAEHNLPFLVADHFTDLCKVMFPDSKIAQAFKCRRTKMTHVLTKAIALHVDKRVQELCRSEKYSIMVDESNDRGGEKVMCILVRVLDRTVMKVSIRFLGLPTCNIGTGANLFNCLNEVLV